MSVQRIVRFVAGLMVLLSVTLGYFVTPWAFLFTGFVGLNLLQSAFTGNCPLVAILRRSNIPEEKLA